MRLALGLAAVLGMVLPAAALDVPPRKPGLWSITLGMKGMPAAAAGMMTSQHCIDASVDQMRNPVTGNARTEQCSKLTFDKTPTGYTFDSTCQMDGGTIQTHGIVTGSFDSAYQMDMTTKHLGSVPAGMPAESHMTIDAKWISACGAGMRPGDVLMANGMKMNVIDMAKGGMPMRQPGGMTPPK
ncbi:MAG: DUF3617 family protein [Pseudolabrys sp.]|nr:DUF3617 family protein [Pseudolabrys sp.]